jgi:hypothetical protein
MQRATTAAVATCLAVLCVAAITRHVSAISSTAPLAQLWIEPGQARGNLFDGPQSVDAARPEVEGRYDVIERDTRGYSITYKVRDARGREWNVKIGPESQSEIVTSRIVWALGYHALPSYFVERWIAVDSSKKGSLLGGARFRPHDLGMKSVGTWSWSQNPFAGTRQLGGLLALMMLLNSTDLKDDNNELYEPTAERSGRPSRLYVVKDLGASLGQTGVMDPKRGDINSFEREPFIVKVESGVISFGYRGRHKGLLKQIGVDDVRWICERMKRLSDRQFRDAFRAGHFTDDQTTRYIARIRQKIDEGLALP